jgi:hypothetical protein
MWCPGNGEEGKKPSVPDLFMITLPLLTVGVPSVIFGKQESL